MKGKEREEEGKAKRKGKEREESRTSGSLEQYVKNKKTSSSVGAHDMTLDMQHSSWPVVLRGLNHVAQHQAAWQLGMSLEPHPCWDTEGRHSEVPW